MEKNYKFFIEPILLKTTKKKRLMKIFIINLRKKKLIICLQIKNKEKKF